jgi:hypothetical protein
LTCFSPFEDIETIAGYFTPVGDAAAPPSGWTRELDASISGAGSVNYYGDPSVQEHISGAGDVKGLGEK